MCKPSEVAKRARQAAGSAAKRIMMGEEKVKTDPLGRA
jgi:hypothetical protein